MKTNQDILIIGGGAVGMTSALELANRGHKVSLIERGETGRGASWAGAGLLVCTSKQPSQVTQLMARSVQLYEHFCNKLKRDTDIDPEFYTSGVLFFDEAAPCAEDLGWPFEVLSKAAIEMRFPLLSTLKEIALLYPHIAQVRNPRFGKALNKAIQDHPNITLCEHEEVLSFEEQNGRVISVKTSLGQRSAGEVLVTAGAWSSILLKSLGFEGEIFPIRGQLLAFDYEKTINIPIVMHGSHYLVPRKDGIILAGSTLENVGFNELPTEAAFEELKAAAFQMMPSLEKATMVCQWAGLRPGINHGKPYIARVPHYENVWINSGHFRNGLVLAPGSAELIADLMEEKSPVVEWD